ncbi:glutamate-5-semialdehyde dehydrogenase [uncultured Algimonas sp.]|uniref:glutamate-5-semialdehyde dehydrogenase n=1 Tax=uncultured Algimonas sp. TaxID=1547920 RepID=UPI002606C8C9|nr:glutamate-5-semialdehyde dehydrogenase [uncultured Algimonas sp.]
MNALHDRHGALADAMGDLGRKARDASRSLATIDGDAKTKALHAVAAALRNATHHILTANAADVEAAAARGLSAAMIDRLTLDSPAIEAIAASVEAIADQDDPVGAVLETWTQPNGLRFRKVGVPIGVIGMIYESRPNVTADAAALCVKSGNAVILRGGSEAVQSNRAILKAVQHGLRVGTMPENAVQLVGTQDRAAVGHLLGGLDGKIDLIIPRGGKGLVNRVQTDARVPVLAHLDGLNHTYVHSAADLGMAQSVILNAKLRRPGVCGATETVLVDRNIAKGFVPDLVLALTDAGCEVRADAAAMELSDGLVAANDTDFDTEHLAPVLNLAVVDDLDAALAHIDRHGSGHTDAIITADADAAQIFLDRVDSAIVMHNASTQFADGGEFGFGAEIGIATGRLHARGPVGAQQLTSYKYQVSGDGTSRQ